MLFLCNLSRRHNIVSGFWFLVPPKWCSKPHVLKTTSSVDSSSQYMNAETLFFCVNKISLVVSSTALSSADFSVLLVQATWLPKALNYSFNQILGPVRTQLAIPIPICRSLRPCFIELRRCPLNVASHLEA